jgi:hypothetical protein
MTYDLKQDFWEKKQGDGSANRFTGKAKFPEGTDLEISKGWDKKDKPKTTTDKAAKAKMVGTALSGAAKIVGQFTEGSKVDYSTINSSSRGNIAETDLTAPGYSDYFARDNNGPV